MVKRRPKPMTPGGLVRKCAYLDPEEADRLRRIAFRLERSESDLMREALAELLDRLEGED
jgi:predicted transcriptional regulator